MTLLYRKPFRREFSATLMDTFAATGSVGGGLATRWAEYVGPVRTAPTADLRAGDWRPPTITPDRAVAVQEAGRQAAGDEFQF